MGASYAARPLPVESLEVGKRADDAVGPDVGGRRKPTAEPIDPDAGKAQFLRRDDIPFKVVAPQYQREVLRMVSSTRETSRPFRSEVFAAHASRQHRSMLLLSSRIVSSRSSRTPAGSRITVVFVR
ncbi:MAG: hypothetical protein ND807_03890 [Vicinamibacterales bacterium]|nr:hypothetical protein [Vicinamibacterales bacterium]